MVVSKFVVLSHAAPGTSVDVADIRRKTDTAYTSLTVTENRQGRAKSMAEDEMRENMQAILKQLDFDPDPQWVWVIGHRQTDDEPEGFRRQCGDRLIQINQKNEQLYAIIMPDGSISLGDCSSSETPMPIIRNVD
jgi:hypothetical protein